MGLFEQMQRAEARKVASIKPAPVPAPSAQSPADLIKPSRETAKRGPKPSGNAKTLITLRLDPVIIEGFKATGGGWQARINAVLRDRLKL